MTRRERVYTAIQRREPDKVPKGEIEINPRLAARLLGVVENKWVLNGVPFEDHRNLLEKLSMDIVVNEMITPERAFVGRDSAGRDLVRDVWGNVRVRSAGIDVYGAGPVESVIKDVPDLRKYNFPDIDNFSAEKTALWNGKTDFFVFVLLGGAFESSRLLMGLEELCLWTYSNFPEIRDFIMRFSEFNIELAKKAVDSGAHGVLISDDMAYNTGTFFSPVMLQKLIFPALKMQVAEIKKKGIPVFLHCDGNINEILQDIVDCGFDGLHALQPSAGMSLAKVKRDYGKRLCLMGNIDLDYTLPFGSQEEVRHAVKKAIESAAAGGGYILSACNSLTQDIPVGNVLAMYETAEEYGSYPAKTAKS